MEYSVFFREATGQNPYPYQERLAKTDPWPQLLEAPTGAGKTEAIVLAWLWRRRHGPAEVRATTPRRLAYTLPMRVLVEQTQHRVKRWLTNLHLADSIGVHLLMGGETDNDWDLYPEREAVLIGTQDMLLSRALNRGYALSRARWPLPYGLLNNDCLWVFDEVQLMGSGLATTAQLAAFRESLGVRGACPTLWVSATLRPDWLRTVDFRSRVDAGLEHAELTRSEWEKNTGSLSKRLNAKKTIAPAKATLGETDVLAQEIRAAHRPATLTLAVVNTVQKAVDLYRALATPPAASRLRRGAQQPATEALAPDVLLLHSRFRPPERQAKLQRLLSTVPADGRIVISTQVIEAGVDISAQIMFTELSPWPSFVQRVGRCNREGRDPGAKVYWIDVDTKEKGQSAPYAADELNAARTELKALKDAGPRALRDHITKLGETHRQKLYPYAPGRVIRRKDVVDLFDTTADLTGADIDISPFIRENDEHDVQVFWRHWEGPDPNKPQAQPGPTSQELCPAPLNENTRLWLKKQTGYRWDFLEKRWQPTGTFTPGQVYLLPAAVGGYSLETGFDPASTARIEPLGFGNRSLDANDSDPYSTEQTCWQTLADHTDRVVEQLDAAIAAVGPLLTKDEEGILRHAARWHDWGKAYHIFQSALTRRTQAVLELPEGHWWAKSPETSGRYERPGFRHELASALAMLAQGHPDLACYLVAAHHGKVRLSLRSLPTEKPAPDGRRFARGVWEGDGMPPANLGSGVLAPEIRFSLDSMEIGLGQDNQPSWAERVLRLRNEIGPFRLAYLEALLCAADRRASANGRLEAPHE